MSEHKLVDGTLIREAGGIVARCTCDWVSRGHFSSLSASATFMAHQEDEANITEDDSHE